MNSEGPNILDTAVTISSAHNCVLLLCVRSQLANVHFFYSQAQLSIHFPPQIIVFFMQFPLFRSAVSLQNEKVKNTTAGQQFNCVKLVLNSLLLFPLTLYSWKDF